MRYYSRFTRMNEDLDTDKMEYIESAFRKHGLDAGVSDDVGDDIFEIAVYDVDGDDIRIWLQKDLKRINSIWGIDVKNSSTKAYKVLKILEKILKEL